MNPRSPLTYYWRHKGSAALRIALIALATAGLTVLVAVLEAAMPGRGNASYLNRISQVTPTGEALDPGTVAQIRSHPGVARTVDDNGLWISMPTLLGRDSQRLMGVSPEDAAFLIAQCGLRLQEGRMFAPRSNEFVLSEEVARALDLEVGSEIERALDRIHYGAVPTPLVLTGILASDPSLSPRSRVRLGFVSGAYLRQHELYAPRTTALLVIAREGRRAEVDTYLAASIPASMAEVETLRNLARLLASARIGVYLIFGLVNTVVAVAVAGVVSIINRIAITERLREFGLLHALGQSLQGLTRRLTLETAVTAGAGWIVGTCLALAVTLWVRDSLFYDLGLDLDLWAPAPFCFALPIPVAAILLTRRSVRRVFARLDAVAIIERGELDGERTVEKGRRGRSSARPLALWQFYLRHRRRGALAVLSTALLVLGTAFPVFLLSALTSALSPAVGHLRRVSEVHAPAAGALDPGTVSQIRSHATVARAVPVMRLGIQMVVPPGARTPVPIYGASQADLPALLAALGLELKEGQLPRPRSNEIVLSAAVAANRGLRVGDVIGGESDDADLPVDDDMPLEMVVTGILYPDEPWIGFASYAYLEDHERTTTRSRRLLVIPREGQKQALDAWLHADVDSGQTDVVTYESAASSNRELAANMVLTFALLECMIAVIAAIALATLNHIFFAQRKAEYGILSALGHSRRWLVLRTVRETGGTALAGWIGGAALCGLGLLCAQVLLYAPRGIQVDATQLVPWLFTAPLPLTVVLASSGTIAWMLRRLDAISIIERKA